MGTKVNSKNKGNGRKTSIIPKVIVGVMVVLIAAVIGLVVLKPQLEGVSTGVSDGEAIKFSELYKVDGKEKSVSDKIKALDGKTVTIKGFMAEQSPVDNSFIYLVNAPFTVCPFCVITDNTKLEVVSIYMADKSKIKYTTEPVEITGRLEVKPRVDTFNYTTQFRIFAKKVKTIKEGGADKEVTAYFNQLNKEKIISALQTDYMNINNALFTKVVDDKTLSLDEKFETIKTDVMVDYILQGIDLMKTNIKRVKSIKPVNPQISKIHDELIKLFEQNQKMLEDVNTINQSIKNESFATVQEKQALIDKLKALGEKNKQGFESFNKWNNSMREN